MGEAELASFAFVCDYEGCGKRFKKNSLLNAHIRIHKNEVKIDHPLNFSHYTMAMVMYCMFYTCPNFFLIVFSEAV